MPAKSKKQYRYFQAIAHGWKPDDGEGPSKEEAAEFVSDQTNEDYENLPEEIEEQEDEEKEEKTAGLADLFRNTPYWKGEETPTFGEGLGKKPRGMQHSIPVREDDNISTIRSVFGSSQSDIPRSKVGRAISKLREAGIEAKLVDEEGKARLEFSYGVGAGYPGSKLDEQGKRVGEPLPPELERVINEALYGEDKQPVEKTAFDWSRLKAADLTKLGLVKQAEDPREQRPYTPAIAGFFEGYISRGDQ